MTLRTFSFFVLIACGEDKDLDSEPEAVDDTGAVDSDSGDSGQETAQDSGEDSAEDSGEDSGEDSAEDSGEDTAEDSAEDSGEDTAADPAEDSGGFDAVPESSRCIEASDTIGACTHGVYADDWSGTVRYEWEVVDGYNHSELTAIEGDTRTLLTTLVTTTSWHMTGGLTVMPDGDLVLGGITLPYVTLSVGDDDVELGPDYVRFIARLSPEGELRWVETIIGITGESIVTAARTDDSVLVSGNIYQTTSFGDDEIATSFFWDATFLAAMDADGGWLWATKATVPADSYTRVYFDDMLATLEGGAEVDVRYLPSADLTIDSFTCAAGVTCPATATVTSDGEWTALVAR